MKILTQLATAPIALLWDEPKPLMLVTLGLADLAFQGDAGDAEQIEFVADIQALQRFSMDIANMATALEERAKKFGFSTTPPVPADDGEELSEEQILAAIDSSKNVTKLGN